MSSLDKFFIRGEQKKLETANKNLLFNGPNLDRMEKIVEEAMNAPTYTYGDPLEGPLATMFANYSDQDIRRFFEDSNETVWKSHPDLYFVLLHEIDKRGMF